jgi:hypothetical protein
MKRELLAFVHIPKTAGSTFTGILREEFRDGEIRLIDAFPDINSFVESFGHPPEELRCIAGHFPIGMDDYLPVPAKYATILRHPIDRVISSYYYAAETPGHYLHDPIKAGDVTFESAVRSGLAEFCNLQTAYVHGITAALTEGPWVGNLLRKAVGDPQDVLSVAKENLRSGFVTFGLTERFDESLLLMRQPLGLSSRCLKRVTRRNVTSRRPREAELSPELLEVIRSHNLLDIELYHYAQSLFDAAIRARRIPLMDRLRQRMAIWPAAGSVDGRSR